MPTGYTDFSSIPTDDLLQSHGWTAHNNTDLNPVVLAGPSPIGGKIAHYQTPQVGHCAISPDAWPVIAREDNPEVLVLLRRQANSDTQIGAAIQAQSNTFASGQLRNNATDVRAARNNGSTWGNIATAAHGLADPNGWTYIRFRKETNAYYVKAWAYGDAEPGAWQIDGATNINITVSGRMGLYCWQSPTASWVEWAYLSYGYSGDSAPMPPSGPPQYALTTDTVGSGSITRDPNAAEYEEDTIVSLTAAPDSGWSFDSWSVDLSGSTNPQNITMDAAKSVTATFTEDAPAPIVVGKIRNTSAAWADIVEAKKKIRTSSDTWA